MAKAPIAAKKLTRKQEALVAEYVSNGGNALKAAEAAGYSTNEASRTAVYRTLKLPHVQQAMMQMVAEEFSRHAPAAVATVAKLSRNAKSEYIQLEASKDLLDRAGFKPIDRQQLQVAGDIRVSIDLGD